MAKKRMTPVRKKNDRQAPLIDNIPKYSQQPRSSPPKRRTDFSSLFRYPSSLSLAHRGTTASPRLSLNEVGSPNLMNNHSDTTNDELSSSSLVQYSNSQGEEPRPCSSPDEMNALGIESVARPLSNSLCKPADKQNGTAEISSFILKKLPDSGSNISATPENVHWWSAEHFEEGSSNTTIEFQDQSYDKGSSSNSSRNGDNDLHLDRGRGKRERKPKVPFDEEVTFALKSTRKLRRIRIMRYLGLAAPVGSPFSPVS